MSASGPSGPLVCFLFFQNKLFQKILTGIPSEFQTDWIQIRPDILFGLTWVQAVCKSYQQKTLGDKELRTLGLNSALSYYREHFTNTDLSDLRIVGTCDILVYRMCHTIM